MPEFIVGWVRMALLHTEMSLRQRKASLGPTWRRSARNARGRPNSPKTMKSHQRRHRRPALAAHDRRTRPARFHAPRAGGVRDSPHVAHPRARLLEWVIWRGGPTDRKRQCCAELRGIAGFGQVASRAEIARRSDGFLRAVGGDEDHGKPGVRSRESCATRKPRHRRGAQCPAGRRLAFRPRSPPNPRRPWPPPGPDSPHG